MPDTSPDRTFIPPPLRESLAGTWDTPEALWADVAADLEWFSPWDDVLREDGPGRFDWFPGGRTNLCYNCLDGHVLAGEGDRVALGYETGERDVSGTVTYAELLDRVERVAAMLRAVGVESGDVVTIYMPTSVPAAVAMLACVRIGAVHAVVSTGYGTGALATRIAATESRVLLTADVGYRKGETVDVEGTVERCLATHPDAGNCLERVVSVHRGEGGDAARTNAGADDGEGEGEGEGWPSGIRYERWADVLEQGANGDGSVADVGATHPACVMHTSGTTGRPKGTVHAHGGYQVFLLAVMRWLFGADRSTVLFVPADVGWAVSQGYGLYGALLTGTSSILFEGTPTYPDAGVWWEVVETRGVTKLITSPSAIRMLMSADPAHENYVLDSLAGVFAGGEPLNDPVRRWLRTQVLEGAVPVAEYYGQTETGGAILGHQVGLRRGSTDTEAGLLPLPGVEVDVVDEEGVSVPAGEAGSLVVERPFPGLTPTLWEGHDRYLDEYWNVVPGAYWTGDVAKRDERGALAIAGRRDDVITVSGHRLSPAAVESAALDHPAVGEAAAVGQPDEKKTETIVLLVVLRPGFHLTDDLRTTIVDRVRAQVGPIAVVGDVVSIDALPKTRTGKVLRRTIRSVLVDDHPGSLPDAVDEDTVAEIRDAVDEADE